MSKIKEFAEEMFEPKLPRGINLYNVMPAYIFEMLRKGAKDMYYVLVYEESQGIKLFRKEYGPFHREMLDTELDIIYDQFPNEYYSVLVLTQDEMEG